MILDEYLREIFGENTQVEQLQESAKIPLAYHSLYDFYQTVIREYPCLILHYKDHYLSSAKLDKHIGRIQSVLAGPMHIVFWFDKLSTAQRKSLLKENIPYVVPKKEIFLPFIYYRKCKQPEMDLQQNNGREKFTISTQCVYIWLFNHGGESYTVHDVAKALKLADMTVSRAMKELERRELVLSTGIATRVKRIRVGKKDYWLKGKDHLLSPVVKTLFSTGAASIESKLVCAGESALACLSMLNPPRIPVFAIYEKDMTIIGKHLHDSPDSLDSNDVISIQIWRYDPRLLMCTQNYDTQRNDCIDPVSLFASMQTDDDIRVQNAIENMMEELLDDNRN